jgi:hypothetical protein
MVQKPQGARAVLAADFHCCQMDEFSTKYHNTGPNKYFLAVKNLKIDSRKMADFAQKKEAEKLS